MLTPTVRVVPRPLRAWLVVALVLACLAPIQSQSAGQSASQSSGQSTGQSTGGGAGRRAGATLPVIRVERDDTVIDTSCIVEIADQVIADANGDGVIRIAGDDIVVDFGGSVLRGAGDEVDLDALTGVGVTVVGRNVTIRNLVLDGFKIGLLAQGVHGGTFEAIEVRRNYAQRLRSTPVAEDGADWLFPHRNDGDEWRTAHGAALCVERSSGVTIRRVMVRRSQNGIMLSRVDDSVLADNDCSFLSGWGLSMWRGSRNTVSRNAFDFCVRGYSHGIYNRGQDSAGILLFEQCSGNVFAENSATHGGDGVFGFAGVEALGQVPPREGSGDEGAEFHRDRGCNDNIFLNNDLSFAAAHGLEMTFSFGNRIVGNRFVGNAICGVWGGYSQRTLIAANRFAENGDGAYGLERGGVNIEHSIENAIVRNIFQRNAVGVRLWWDEDAGLLETPWAKANDTASRDNVIALNTFDGDQTAIELVLTENTVIADNRFNGVQREIVADDASQATIVRKTPAPVDPMPQVTIVGDSRPVGARRHLAGRDRIVMTEWGPYDWASPLLRLSDQRRGIARWELLGDRAIAAVELVGPDGMVGGRSDVRSDVRGDVRGDGRGDVRGDVRGDGLIDADNSLRVRQDGSTFDVTLAAPDRITDYRVRVTLDDGTALEAAGTLLTPQWKTTFFAWSVDPRDALEAWRAQGASGTSIMLPALELSFGHRGPGSVVPQPEPQPEPARGPGEPESAAAIRSALDALPADRFGTLAETTLHFPAGTYEFTVTSDDGVRLTVGDEVLLEDWTWHAPRTERRRITLAEPATLPIRVEHFELDGFAVLRVEIAPVQ